MRESPTFQAILEEGREEGRQIGLQEGLQEGREEGVRQGLRESLLRIGGKRFGIASSDVVTAIQNIQGIARLTELEDRLLAVESWDELLTDPER